MIEWFVVIAIIAILIGLLFPAPTSREIRAMHNTHTKPPAIAVIGPVAGRAEGCPDPEAWEEVRSIDHEWLATLSHELRSPLATVVYALETISGERDLEADTRRARDVAERQARRALQLVDDLFDLCAGSRGKLSLRNEVVDLAEVVATATETVVHLFAPRGHRLTVSLPPQAGNPLRGSTAPGAGTDEPAGERGELYPSERAHQPDRGTRSREYRLAGPGQWPGDRSRSFTARVRPIPARP